MERGSLTGGDQERTHRKYLRAPFRRWMQENADAKTRPEASTKNGRGLKRGRAQVCRQIPELSEPDLQQGMRKAFKKAHGAGGVDGHHGDEIAVLPEEVADRFYEVTKSWRRRATAPKMMHNIIQASLQKANKEPDVANLRPLSIFSCWWRVFEASTLQTQWFRRWRSAIGTEEVACRESAEEIAAQVATKFAELEFLAALDYSKGYDHMRSDISGARMKEAGVPTELIDVLTKVWGDQRRYISFDGYVNDKVLTTSTAHPQGGPWGPAIMQLLMIAGVLCTKQMEQEARGKDAEESLEEQPRKRQRLAPDKARKADGRSDGGEVVDNHSEARRATTSSVEAAQPGTGGSQKRRHEDGGWW